MKNPDLISFEYVKENKLLYIENDLTLSDLDDYKIEYLFDAYSNKYTFSKIEEYDNILLRYSFHRCFCRFIG